MAFYLRRELTTEGDTVGNRFAFLHHHLSRIGLHLVQTALHRLNPVSAGGKPSNLIAATRSNEHSMSAATTGTDLSIFGWLDCYRIGDHAGDGAEAELLRRNRTGRGNYHSAAENCYCKRELVHITACLPCPTSCDSNDC